MGALKHSLPFGFLALLPLGAWLGGPWVLLPAIGTPILLTVFDATLGDAGPAARLCNPTLHRALAWLYVPLQLAALGGAAALAARPETGFAEAAGLALSTGFTVGIFGFVTAHELVHSEARWERMLGLSLLAASFYMHFRIAHVHGHHRRAATVDDPATARLGESLYAFLPRSIAGQFAEAWRFESERLRRAGRAAAGPRNRMLAYLGLEALLALAVGLVSWRALAFVATSAVVAVLLLEGFNYIAHYGLARRSEGGRPCEPLGPQHSWNSARRMNNWSLMNMGRHSDHHLRATRPYQGLEPMDGAPELPCGYAGAILLSLIPPLWSRVMDPRAAAAMARPTTLAAAA